MRCSTLTCTFTSLIFLTTNRTAQSQTPGRRMTLERWCHLPHIVIFNGPCCIFELRTNYNYLPAPRVYIYSKLLVLIQSQRNAVHTFHNYFFKIHSNIVPPLRAMTSKKSLLFRIALQSSKRMWHHNVTQSRKQIRVISEFLFCDNKGSKKHELPPLHKKPKSFTSGSVLIGGNDIASGISPLVSMASSTLIMSSSVPSASHAALQEQVSPPTQSMQFCNTTTHIKVLFSVLLYCQQLAMC